MGWRRLCVVCKRSNDPPRLLGCIEMHCHVERSEAFLCIESRSRRFVSLRSTLHNLRSHLFKCNSACGSKVLRILSVFRFCARRAQKRNTKERKVPLRMTIYGHHVTRVNMIGIIVEGHCAGPDQRQERTTADSSVSTRMRTPNGSSRIDPLSWAPESASVASLCKVIVWSAAL